MCTGETTNLVCGHALVHFATRCELECHFPVGPFTHIKDTCAACHPEHRISCLTQEYNGIMGKLKSQYENAVREGRADDATRLQRRIGEATWELAQLISTARRTGWPCDGEVIWPGKREDW